MLQPAFSADAIGASAVAAAAAIVAAAIAAANAAAIAAAIAAAAIAAAAIATTAIAAAHFHSRYRFRAAIEFAICSYVHVFLGSPCGVVRRRVSMYVLEARP